MEFKYLKSVGDFCVVLAICLSISSCVECQAPTQKPIATTPKPATPVTAKDGSIVIEIQTPPTTPSNVISVINAKPADNRPIQPTPPPTVKTTVTLKPTPPTVKTTVTLKPNPPGTTKPTVKTTVTLKPNPPATTKPTVKTTVTLKPNPTTKPLVTNPPIVPSGVNIMAIKTGFLSVANDPCSYVSCIRADSFLHCGIVRCDPGQAFSQATGRCIASNQCVAIKPKK